MNIESLINKIKIFRELVIDSGFKRNVIDFKQSIAQAQNQSLIFMKGLSEKVKENLIYFENNSLHSELRSVLRENETDISTELRTETATVRERLKKLDEKEKQLLLDKYTIKEEDKKKRNKTLPTTIASPRYCS